MGFRYYAPLDPRCPGARELFQSLESGLEDPMTEHYGCGDVVEDLFEERASKHRSGCKRCQIYGKANIEVRD